MTCQKTKTYSKKTDATMELLAIDRRPRAQKKYREQRSYYCRQHEGWHLTSMERPPRRRGKRR